MISLTPSLEHLVMKAVRQNTLASTNEVSRYVNAMGHSTGRSAVRNALRALEERGVLKNIGADSDAWRLP